MIKYSRRERCRVAKQDADDFRQLDEERAGQTFQISRRVFPMKQTRTSGDGKTVFQSAFSVPTFSFVPSGLLERTAPVIDVIFRQHFNG